ncbi:hypothetical protein Bbelb_415700 [Branchiostoma belcheri]|nr:hypothetical protein Bbelb_415700 [Branchiostoma belcheri]
MHLGESFLPSGQPPGQGIICAHNGLSPPDGPITHSGEMKTPPPKLLRLIDASRREVSAERGNRRARGSFAPAHKLGPAALRVAVAATSIILPVARQRPVTSGRPDHPFWRNENAAAKTFALDLIDASRREVSAERATAGPGDHLRPCVGQTHKLGPAALRVAVAATSIILPVARQRPVTSGRPDHPFWRNENAAAKTFALDRCI